MATEKNALKKLASDLGMFADFNRDADRVNGYVVTKAKLVIAELAKEFEPIDHSKVKPSEDGRVHFGDILKYGDKRRCDILAKCREIAEQDISEKGK